MRGYCIPYTLRELYPSIQKYMYSLEEEDIPLLLSCEAKSILWPPSLVEMRLLYLVIEEILLPFTHKMKPMQGSLLRYKILVPKH